MKRKKVIVIGVDGGCWDIIKMGIAEGRLPTFERMIRDGVSGELKSTIPYTTWPAWTSAVTGVNPGKHNIYHFLTFENDRYRVLTAADRMSDPIWKILTRNGLRVGVVNVPVTYPPDQDIEGFMISGIGAMSTDSEFTYPDGLKGRLLSEGYRLDAEEMRGSLLDLSVVLDIQEVRKRITLDLLREGKWDFFMVVLTATDVAEHMKLRYLDQSAPDYDSLRAETAKNEILRAYSSTDEFLQGVLRLIDTSTEIIILSDHGFGLTNKVFYVNTWLMDQGYLAVRKPLGRSIILKLGLSRKNVIRFMRLFTGALPLSLKARLRKLTIADNAPKHFPSSRYDIDFVNTKAWFYGECCIKVNLMGREPRGAVDDTQYEIIRNELIHGLREISDPETGERVVEAAYRREEVYHGSCVGNAADIIFQMRKGYRSSTKLVPNKCVADQDPRERGYHEPYGILIAHGPSIRSGIGIKGANIVDIVPTTLHILGLPIPDYLDGRVLKEIFKEDSDEAQRKLCYIHYSERERLRETIDHLVALKKMKGPPKE